MVKPDRILNNFGRESVALIHFRLGHTPDPDRLRVNLSVPAKALQPIKEAVM
jgi:hypothetical protein